ncbi:MAG: UTP--glucose-1-phosphate uridylyltransferase GalU [Bacilli bacterium]
MKITKAVIPVAGMGTRFLPITKSIPKEMLPIIDTPTIHFIVSECINSGIKEILFITSGNKKTLEDYFDDNYELEKRIGSGPKLEVLNKVKDIYKNIKIYFIRQGEPMGSGHAIKLAKEFVGNDSFAVLYGDDLMYSKNVPVLKQLINLHEEKMANIIGVQEVRHEDTYKYGIVDINSEYKINKLVEKPKIEEAPSNLAGLGRYIVSSNIFPILENLSSGANGEYQFTDAMAILMKKEPFYACKFDGTYYDTGSKLGYLKATVDFALLNEELSKDFKEYLNTIK